MKQLLIVYPLMLIILLILSLPAAQSETNPQEIKDFTEYFASGIRHYDNGEYEEAILVFEKILEILPESDYLRFKLGLCYSNIGNEEQAVIEWRKVIAINPNFADAHYHLGVSYRYMGLMDESIKEYKQAIATNPHSPYPSDEILADSYLGLSAVYASLKQYPLSLDTSKKAVYYNPQSYETHYNLAVSYRDVGLINEAIAEFKQSIELNLKELTPNNELLSDSYLNLSDIYSSLKEYSSGFEASKKAVYYNPKSASAHYNLALFYQTYGLIDKAITEYKHSIELNLQRPDFYNELLSNSYSNLSAVYASQQQYTLSIEAAKKAVYYNPESVNAHINLGSSYCLIGNPKLANYEYQQTVKLGKSSLLLLFTINKYCSD